MTENTKTDNSSSLSSDAVILQRKLVILPQWMADPVVRAEDADEVGVADEVDADQVERFPLMPVGDGPDVRDARDFGELSFLVVLPSRQLDFDVQEVLVRVTVQVIDDLDVRIVGELLGPFGIRFQVVDSSQVIQSASNCKSSSCLRKCATSAMSLAATSTQGSVASSFWPVMELSPNLSSSF